MRISSLLLRCFNLLSKRDKTKIAVISIAQALLSFLDLIAVGLIGLFGALSVSGIQGTTPGNQTQKMLVNLGIDGMTIQMQYLLLGGISLLLLVGRTVLSIYLTRRILFFLSRKGAELSGELVSKILSQSLLVMQARTSQESLFAVTTGIQIIVLQVLATVTVVVSDISLLIVMCCGLFLLNTYTAIATVSIFALVGATLYKFMHVKSRTLGATKTEYEVKISDKVIEVFSSFRESIIRNRRNYYSREVRALQNSLADTRAELSFMPYVSKYVLESTVIVGAMLMSGILFLLQDPESAFGTIAVFLAAGSRIAPAVLRIQQGLIQVNQGLSSANTTLQLFESLEWSSSSSNEDDFLHTEHLGFVPKIVATELTFTYPGKLLPAIKDVSLQIQPGSLIAIVGTSGSGKTTLVDLLLGVINPNKGTVEISDAAPKEAIEKWPGAIAYVPQDIQLSSGTVRENVAIGFPPLNISDELISDALRMAKFDDFIESTEHELQMQIGEKGSKLSGGQRQRLGIARALLTKPKLIVLDEATSALDAQVEANLSTSINELRGFTTILIVAHRLSTVRSADQVIYMENGSIVTAGTFSEVRASVPNFEKQAKLMGL